MNTEKPDILKKKEQRLSSSWDISVDQGHEHLKKKGSSEFLKVRDQVIEGAECTFLSKDF